jgi:hypothetical protein
MERDAAGADYADYHSPIKLDGRWKVVAKLANTVRGITVSPSTDGGREGNGPKRRTLELSSIDRDARTR